MATIDFLTFDFTDISLRQRQKSERYSRWMNSAGIVSCLASVFLVVVFACQAAETSDDEISRLVRQLGDDSFEKREAANSALEKIGPRALPALSVAARNSDAEVRRRAAELTKTTRNRLRKLALELEQAGADTGGGTRDGFVGNVDLIDIKDSARLMPLLAVFSELKDLTIYNTDVSDTDLVFLSSLSQLQYLTLGARG